MIAVQPQLRSRIEPPSEASRNRNELKMPHRYHSQTHSSVIAAVTQCGIAIASTDQRRTNAAKGMEYQHNATKHGAISACGKSWMQHCNVQVTPQCRKGITRCSHIVAAPTSNTITLRLRGIVVLRRHRNTCFGQSGAIARRQLANAARPHCVIYSYSHYIDY